MDAVGDVAGVLRAVVKGGKDVGVDGKEVGGGWDLAIAATKANVVEVLAQYAHVVLVVPNFRAIPPHVVQPIRVYPLFVTRATVPCHFGVSLNEDRR